MGANISTTVDKALSTIENVSKTSCSMNQAVDQSISGISVFMEESQCGDISFTQKAKIIGVCDMGAMAAALAEASTELTKDQVAALGIGMNVDTTIRDRASIIKQKLEQSCSSESLIKQNISGIVVRLTKGSSCDTLKFIQDADLTTQCTIKVVMDSLDSDEFKGSFKQTVSFFAGFGIGKIILILVLLGIAGGIVTRIMRKASKATDTTSVPSEVNGGGESLLETLQRGGSESTSSESVGSLVQNFLRTPRKRYY